MCGAISCSGILHSPLMSTISGRCISDMLRRNSKILKMCPHSRVWCIPLQQSVRNHSKFVRSPERWYFPEGEGKVPARESLAKIPKETPKESLAQRLKTSGEIFTSLMGEIHTSRNKHLVAVEGARQVDDAISFGLKLKTLFLLKSIKKFPENIAKVVSQYDESQQANSTIARVHSSSQRPEVHKIGLDTLQDWSSLKTPPGIIGVFEKPTKAFKIPVKANYKKLPLIVVLDNVREPGNLGSILRTAAGVGCEVLLSEGCVDPWDTKSLRGGNGAQFLVTMTPSVDLQYLHQYIPYPDNPSVDSPEENKVEKKGVAVVLADSGTNVDKYGIPIVDYTSIQYSKFEWILLVLGGETHGLSETVRKVAKELPNYYPDDIKLVSRIRIPMSLPIDSLNVANAFGVIGYEIFRQLNTGVV